jgi:hypothetical protein
MTLVGLTLGQAAVSVGLVATAGASLLALGPACVGLGIG